MLEKRSLSTSSINLSFDEPEPEEKRVESGEELKIDSEKYQKIGILTDLNNITESEAQIKYIDKVKYYNDYKLIKTLGAGSICKVKLVEKDNVKYALKIVNKNILSKKKKFEQDENGKMVITTPMEGILKEIAILKKVNHRNLVKLYEIMYNKNKGKIYLVLEYCEHGDLMSFDEEKNIFTVNKYIFEKHLKKIKAN
jgi:serine/threonine protein kinase